jgi:hypothetical protein
LCFNGLKVPHTKTTQLYNDPEVKYGTTLYNGYVILAKGRLNDRG